MKLTARAALEEGVVVELDFSWGGPLTQEAVQRIGHRLVRAMQCEDRSLTFEIDHEKLPELVRAFSEYSKIPHYPIKRLFREALGLACPEFEKQLDDSRATLRLLPFEPESSRQTFVITWDPDHHPARHAKQVRETV